MGNDRARKLATARDWQARWGTRRAPDDELLDESFEAHDEWWDAHDREMRGRVDLLGLVRLQRRVRWQTWSDYEFAVERATRYVLLLTHLLHDDQADELPWSLTPDRLPVLDLSPTVAQLRAHTLLTAAPPCPPAPTLAGACQLVA